MGAVWDSLVQSNKLLAGMWRLFLTRVGLWSPLVGARVLAWFTKGRIPTWSFCFRQERRIELALNEPAVFCH